MGVFDWLKNQYRNPKSVTQRIAQGTKKYATEYLPQVGLGAVKTIGTAANLYNRANTYVPRVIINKATNRNINVPNVSQPINNFTDRYKPTTTLGKVGRFVGENAPYAAIPAASMPLKVRSIASPIIRLGTMSGIRGAEGAAIGAGMDIGQGKSAKETIRNANMNLLIGAGANAVLSPRVLMKAGQEAATNARAIQLANKEKARLFKMYKNIAGTTVQRDINASLFGNKYTSKLGNKMRTSSPLLNELAQADTPQKVEAIVKRELTPQNVGINAYDPNRVNLPTMGKSGGFARLPQSEPTGAGNVGGKVGGEENLSTIRSQIRKGGKIEKTSAKQVIADAETQFYNRFAPVERLEKGKNLLPSQRPSSLIKRTTGSDGIANAKLEFEVSPILKTVENDLDNLDTLMVAQRMDELATQGRSKSSGSTLSELRAEIGEERFAKLNNAAEQLRAFQDKLLQEWKSVGGLSDEGYNLIKSRNQQYTPFQRVMDDLEQTGFVSKSMNPTSPIKTLKGSDRAIESPLESIVQNTYRMQKAIEKNRAMNALVNLGEDVAKPTIDTTGKSTINVFINGQKKAFEVSKDVADSIKGIDEEQLNLAVRAMAFPAKILRAGATGLNVGFAVPNLIRDQLSAAVNSKYGGIPVYDFVSGLASVLKKDKSYQNWLLSGADMASMVAQDRSSIRKTLGEVAKNRTGLGRFIKDPLELARIVSEMSEKGSRVGVFKRATRGAEKAGLKGFDVSVDAMREAREATVDFAQRGSKTKAWNAITPFFNARLQGAGKLLQSFRKRPVQTGLIGTAIATVPAATLYAYNSRFPDFFEIPDYERENNFIIMTGKKDVPYYKIPKGEIGRIFGNPVEHFMGYLRGEDQKSFAEMSKDLLVGLSPVQGLGDVIPTAFSIPLQVATNYDTFRKRNIVSPYQKDLPPEAQFDKTTSETSKWIGQKLGLSPAKIDFVLKGYGAGVAKQGLQFTDATIFGKTPETADLPVLDRFMGEKSDLNKTATKIYEAENKRKQEQARTNFGVKQRIEEYLRTGNEQLLQEAIEANPKSFKQFFNDAVEKQSQEGMTPTEKAIQSLPKSQQEEVRNNLGLLPTTNPNGLVDSASAAENKPNVSEKLTKAQLEIEKIKFERSEGSFKDLGDYVLRKASDGDVTAQPKIQYDADVMETKKTRLKKNGDFNGWLDNADKLYSNYEQQLQDQTLDELEKMKIQGKMDDLIAEAKKYKGYGGFKKGKKAKKISLTLRRPSRSNFRTTISAPRLSQPKVINLTQAAGGSNGGAGQGGGLRVPRARRQF